MFLNRLDTLQIDSLCATYRHVSVFMLKTYHFAQPCQYADTGCRFR